MKQNKILFLSCSTSAQSKYSPGRCENLEDNLVMPLSDGLKIKKKQGEQHLYSCDNQRHFWADGVGDCSGALNKFF